MIIRNDTTLASLAEALKDEPDYGMAPDTAALAMLVGYVRAVCRQQKWPFVHADVVAMFRNGENIGSVLLELSIRLEEPEPDDDDDFRY